MAKNYLKEILTKLNKLLESENLPSVREDQTAFVMEKDVNYAEEWTVSGSKVFYADNLNDVIAPLVINGPSWIHANMLFTAEKIKIITLRFGASVGNSNPNINTSFERDKMIIIVDS